MGNMGMADSEHHEKMMRLGQQRDAVRARRPVDDALDRLTFAAREMPYAGITHYADDIATMREALERLRRHPDAWSQEAFDQQKARADAAEAEVQQLREERDALLNWKRSMSASPSDGPDDFCEHGYTTENAAHPSAGLERCPTCSPTDGGGAK